MNWETDNLRALLIGEQRRRTRIALLAAAVLFLMAMLVDYITLSSVVAGRDPGIFPEFRNIFRMHEPQQLELSSLKWIYGYVLVGGLASIYAYFNAGYLLSLLLALSPNIGTALWSIHGFDEYMTLTPLLVFDRILPEGPLVATLGFFLGVGLRAIAYPSSHRSRDPDVPDR